MVKLLKKSSQLNWNHMHWEENRSHRDKRDGIWRINRESWRKQGMTMIVRGKITEDIGGSHNRSRGIVTERNSGSWRIGRLDLVYSGFAIEE